MLSAAVFPDHFGVGEDVAFHGALYVGLRCARFLIQLCIQRIELEEVPVRIARWRTRSSVADFAEIVAPLPRAIRKLLLLGHSFGNFSGLRRQIEYHPMDPRAGGSIRVVHNQREALRFCW